jgi:hypothetical protein
LPPNQPAAQRRQNVHGELQGPESTKGNKSIGSRACWLAALLWQQGAVVESDQSLLCQIIRNMQLMPRTVKAGKGGPMSSPPAMSARQSGPMFRRPPRRAPAWLSPWRVCPGPCLASRALRTGTPSQRVPAAHKPVGCTRQTWLSSLTAALP